MVIPSTTVSLLANGAAVIRTSRLNALCSVSETRRYPRRARACPHPIGTRVEPAAVTLSLTPATANYTLPAKARNELLCRPTAPRPSSSIRSCLRAWRCRVSPVTFTVNCLPFGPNPDHSQPDAARAAELKPSRTMPVPAASTGCTIMEAPPANFPGCSWNVTGLPSGPIAVPATVTVINRLDCKGGLIIAKTTIVPPGMPALADPTFIVSVRPADPVRSRRFRFRPTASRPRWLGPLTLCGRRASPDTATGLHLDDHPVAERIGNDPDQRHRELGELRNQLNCGPPSTDPTILILSSCAYNGDPTPRSPNIVNFPVSFPVTVGCGTELHWSP